MDVRVVHAAPTAGHADSDYVRVQTCADPDDDTVTLATIERVVDKTIGSDEEGSLRRRVKTLIMRRPMSLATALGLATRYAERKKIAVVYADQE